MFDFFWGHGIVRKAIEQKKIFASATNIRNFACGRHRVTDDRPYGGGSGMLMKPEPIAGAIRASKKKFPDSKTVLLTPRGIPFNQNLAQKLVSFTGLIFVCGRYEGVDERISDNFVDFEISIGDFILTGGELAAMIIIDSVIRLIPGVLGGADSAEKDSFSDSLLEHPHYTRPEDFEGKKVPEVLLSGNHKAIEQWRLERSLILTIIKRHDLMRKKTLNICEIEILRKWRLDVNKILHDQSLCGTDTLSGSE